MPLVCISFNLASICSIFKLFKFEVLTKLAKAVICSFNSLASWTTLFLSSWVFALAIKLTLNLETCDSFNALSLAIWSIASLTWEFSALAYWAKCATWFGLFFAALIWLIK